LQFSWGSDRSAGAGNWGWQLGAGNWGLGTLDRQWSSDRKGERLDSRENTS